LVTIENLKINNFVIVEFIDEKSVKVVPCSWINADQVEKQFKCHWPMHGNVSKLSASQKQPSSSWKIHLCIPRKFFRKL